MSAEYIAESKPDFAGRTLLPEFVRVESAGGQTLLVGQMVPPLERVAELIRVVLCPREEDRSTAGDEDHLRTLRDLVAGMEPESGFVLRELIELLLHELDSHVRKDPGVI